MAEGSSFLRNGYWVLRHGKSIPNEKGLVVSSMVRFSLSLQSVFLFSGIGKKKSFGSSNVIHETDFGVSFSDDPDAS